MKREAYSGTITTTGRSEALRLDKALFRQHPEFRQKAKLQASVLGPGTLLVQVIDESPQDDDTPDPVIAAFLAFLERDIVEHPEKLRTLDPATVALAQSLTQNIILDEIDNDIDDDVTF